MACLPPLVRGQQDCLSWDKRADLIGTCTNNAQRDCIINSDCVTPGLCSVNGPGRAVTFIAAAYDSRRGVTVLFHYPTGQTWEFTGQKWRQFVGDPNPGENTTGRATMVYDSRRLVCVLFDFLFPFEWDGETWTIRDVPFPQGVIQNYGAAYDGARGVTVLYGGSVGGIQRDETWEYDGATWTQRFPANHPPPLVNHRMAYDSVRGVVVLFSPTAGLWEYDGIDWTPRTSAFPPSPSARNDFAMDFDSARGVTIMHGGAAGGPSRSDTWEWDGANWTERLPGNPDAAIIARSKHVLVFDSARKRSLVLGGAASGGFSLELVAPEAPTPQGIPLSVIAVEGDPAQFFVTATGGNPLTVQWRHNGVPLPGAMQQTLSFASVAAKDQGVYDAILGSGEYVPFTCPTSISNAGILTVLPAIPGDVDGDGDFDLEDFASLLNGFTGPGP